MALPPGSYAFQSVTTQKFLLYKTHVETVHDIHQFSGVDFGNPNAKFQVEIEEESQGGLVHIRSPNGKYWTRQDGDSFWIVAKAAERNNDTTSLSCTLFKPEKADNHKPDNENRLYRFRYVPLQSFIQPYSENNLKDLLNAHQTTLTDDQIFVVIDG